MLELRDLREILNKSLQDRGINAWIFEEAAGARPENVIETSLDEVQSSDIFLGLFWKNYDRKPAG